YGDWWMHFDLSRVYIGMQSLSAAYFSEYTVPSRTPLFNLYEGFFLSMTGGTFASYQVTALVPALACVTACVSFVSREARFFFLVLLALNPFVANQVTYPWPKMLASGYVIICLILLRRLTQDTRSSASSLIVLGIAAGLSVL